VKVNVTSSDSSVVTVADQNGFPISTICVTGNPTHVTLITHGVTSAHTAQITAQFNNNIRTASITVQPPTLASVTIDKPSLTSMQSATGTVTMSAPLTNGVALLSSSDPSVSVP